MRVVSGTARGCKLQPVPGMNTRPTTDRVKENVFNLIQDHVRGAEVLDLFAGTGQLGIEALSRGAKKCTFVENNRQAYKVVEENVKHCKLEQGASVIIRPSGTEPKIKAYYTTIGDTRADAEAQEEKLVEDFKGILGF